MGDNNRGESRRRVQKVTWPQLIFTDEIGLIVLGFWAVVL